MKRAPRSRTTRSWVEYMERMCEDWPPERREVEGKGEGEAFVGRWDCGVVKGEKDDMAECGVPWSVEMGVSRVDIARTR